jgi:oligoribonuclease NrnB/cAMP/cGMP phosphodiesterase (DHH superfamily)
MYLINMMKVIYHKNCIDGFTSAYVVWLHYGKSAEYIPWAYEERQCFEPELMSDCDVVIVDFSFKREQLEKIKKVAKSLVVLDHHKTAMADLQGLPYARFDMSKSGARLAWEFFFIDKKPISIVEYAEDHDLWKHSLPHSKQFSMWIKNQEFTFERWKQINTKLECMSDDFVRTISEHQNTINSIVNNIAAGAYQCRIAGYDAKAVNSPIYQSEIGELLCKEATVAVIFWETNDKVVASLRSKTVDVSDIAKIWGGGGHKAAAGFDQLKGNPHVWELGS